MSMPDLNETALPSRGSGAPSFTHLSKSATTSSVSLDLGGISIPTLVLWGESDWVVTPDYGRAYARLIPGSRFELIEGAGHHPEIEQPETFVERVSRFLEE